jgi:hypothetical protein
MQDDIDQNPLTAAFSKLDSSAKETKKPDNLHIDTNSNGGDQLSKDEVVLPPVNNENKTDVGSLDAVQEKSIFTKIKGSLNNIHSEIDKKIAEKKRTDTSTENFDIDEEIEAADKSFGSDHKDKKSRNKGGTTIVKVILVTFFFGVAYFVFNTGQSNHVEPKESTLVESIEMPEIINPPTNVPINEITTNNDLNPFLDLDISDYKKESVLIEEANNSSKQTESIEIKEIKEDVPDDIVVTTDSSLFDIPVISETAVDANVIVNEPVKNELPSVMDDAIAAPESIDSVEFRKEIEAIKNELADLNKKLIEHTTPKKNVKLRKKPKIEVHEIASSSKNCEECISHALITYNKEEFFVGDGENFKDYHIVVRGDRVIFTNRKTKTSESYWNKSNVN